MPYKKRYICILRDYDEIIMSYLVRYIYIASILIIGVLLLSSCQKEPVKLKWDKTQRGEMRTLVLEDDTKVRYAAYEKILYTSKESDSSCQYMNIYVPCRLREDNPPIFLKTYVGGYMSSKARGPIANDATAYALSEGYIVCIVGSRGWNSKVHGMFVGRAPSAILDLKAAVRYLHANDSIMPGDAERIIADGTSAGGALVALLGASGNNADYDLPLELMGAADARDDIWTVVSYCPITNLEHSDMAYEWQFCTINDVRGLSDREILLSNQLASLFPEYLASQGVAEEKMESWISGHILQSAAVAVAEGQEIAPETGVSLSDTTLNMLQFLRYMEGVQPLKSPPAFDALNVVNKYSTFENKLFGSTDGQDANFTDFAVKNQLSGNYKLSDDVKWRTHLMNPMDFIGKKGSTMSKHWYIRYGVLDRDTSFPLQLLLKHKLIVAGADVNFALQWGEAHSGDYRLTSLFEWLAKIQ